MRTEAGWAYTLVIGQPILARKRYMAPTSDSLRLAEQDVNGAQTAPLHWDSSYPRVDDTPVLLAYKAKLFKLSEAEQNQQELLPGMCPRSTLLRSRY